MFHYKSIDLFISENLRGYTLMHMFFAFNSAVGMQFKEDNRICKYSLLL